MTIYLDIIFIENLIMNYIILFGTAFALNYKSYRLKALRIFSASLIGAVYSTLSYTSIFPILCNNISKFIISIIMVLVAFKLTPLILPEKQYINFIKISKNVLSNQSIKQFKKNFANHLIKLLKQFIKNFIMFYLISFVIGGVSFAIICMIKNKNTIKTYPIKINLIAGIIGFITFSYSFANNKRLMKNNDLICYLQITLLGKTFNVKALVDSGNTLKDPYLKRNVIIIEKQLIEKKLHLNFELNLSSQSNIYNSYKNFSNKLYDKNNNNNNSNSSNININNLTPILIPYHSVGSSKMLIGIVPSKVVVELDNKTTELNQQIILGLCNEKISTNYSALIGLNLLDSIL